MFRHDGYLNLAQLFNLVWEEWDDALLRFQPSDEGAVDYPSVEQRRRAFVAWGVRTLFDQTDETALFNGAGGFVRLDSWCVFLQSPSAKYEFASDLPIVQPVTEESIALYERQLLSGWLFISGDFGTVRLRRGLLESISKREDAIVSQIRRALAPYHGWTVGICETAARNALKEISLNSPLSTETKGALSPLEYTYQCFVSAFPEGKGNTTWPEVQRITGFSRRHIKRAMEAFDKAQ
jgi:hypothetical protein